MGTNRKNLFTNRKNLLVLISVLISVNSWLIFMCIGCNQIEKSKRGLIVPDIFKEIEVILKTDKTSYRAKEEIPFRLIVTNKGDKAFTYTFPSAQLYDFVVKRNGKEVWCWSKDKVFAMMLINLTLEPKQSVTYTEKWDKRNKKGSFVPAGDYELMGIIKTEPQIISNSIVIRVLDSSL